MSEWMRVLRGNKRQINTMASGSPICQSEESQAPGEGQPGPGEERGPGWAQGWTDSVLWRERAEQESKARVQMPRLPPQEAGSESQAGAQRGPCCPSPSLRNSSKGWR